jgi:uncharacterized protein YoxC
MADIDYEKLADAIKKGLPQTSLGDPKALEDFLKNLKQSQTGFKTFKDAITGTQKNLIDVSDEISKYNDAIKELTRTEKTAKNEVDRKTAADKRAVLEKERQIKAEAMISKNMQIAGSNFAAGIVTAVDGVMSGAMDFAKGLLSSQSGVELATAMAAKSARSTGDAMKSIGDGVEMIGLAMAVIAPEAKAFGIALKWLGPIVAGVGAVFSKILGKSSETTAEIIEAAGKEVTRTKDAFTKMTSTGAEFAQGMTELRDYAAYAGLDVEQFGNVIKNAAPDLAHMGMGIGEAAKRIAGVNHALREGDLGNQLYKLGYSFEEQAELGATVAAQLQASGKLRTTSDAEVARLTAQYGKDLKVLADITGADAKKKAENARLESMRAEIMARLGPEERERFQAQLRGMPEELQKGFIQYVVSGGTVVIDAATNILRTQYSQIDTIYQEGFKNIRDNNKTASQVQTEALEQGAILGKQIGDVSRATGAVLNTANTLSGGLDGAAGSAADMTNKLIQQTNYTKEAVQTAKENTDKAAVNVAKLDKGVTDLEAEIQKTKATWTRDLTPTLANYVTSADTLAYWTTKLADSFKDIVTQFGGGGAGGGAKGTQAGNTSGGVAIGAGAAGEFEGLPGTATPGTKVSDLIRFGGNTGDRAHFDQLNAGVKNRFNQMIQEYGKPVTVTSAYRSAEEQARIKAAGGIMAAAPGHSKHESGTAIDLDRGDVAALQASGLLQKYGFQGLLGDAVHIQSVAANGANLGVGQTALVGERGPEIVHGPGSVTSTASTSRIFNEMLDKLDEMVDVLKDHRDTSEKILHATA